jgi:hypothetical protein
LIIFDYHNMSGYIPWLRANPDWYVVNFRWKGGKHLVVHRASAGHISRAEIDYGREGDHSGKACATDVQELREWAKREYGKSLDPCGHCRVF